MAKVLVVDDHERNCYLRSQILEEAGYDCIQASTGTEAVEKCTSEKPDLLLLDIHLPDFSGFEVCRRIRANQETASVMIIQISASALDLKDALTGLSGGADDFLLEPVEPELLVAKVRSLMRLRFVEERLRRSNKDLAQFAAAASHDLREPLRAIIAFSELLHRDYRTKLDGTALSYLDQIVTGGKRMSALIQDLLNYSRVSSTAEELNEVVDMGEVVEEVREWLKDALVEAKATISYSALPKIQGPKVRLAQLIRNLIENAIKYRRPHVPLQVAVGAIPGRSEWLFTVADNGQGFDPVVREEIFDVFKRFDTGNAQGTGMGLAICRAVVESAGGKIWSVGRPGEGATFYFTWPATSVASARAT